MRKRTRTRLAEGPGSTVANGAERDNGGRFAKGNSASTGRRGDPLRSAIRAAVSAQDIEAIVGRLLASAKRGSIAASKLLLGYALGTPRPMEQHVRLDLGKLDTTESCSTAAALVARSAAAGEIDLESAKQVSELIAFASDGHRIEELEQGLEALRQQLAGDGFSNTSRRW